MSGFNMVSAYFFLALIFFAFGDFLIAVNLRRESEHKPPMKGFSLFGNILQLIAFPVTFVLSALDHYRLISYHDLGLFRTREEKEAADAASTQSPDFDKGFSAGFKAGYDRARSKE